MSISNSAYLRMFLSSDRYTSLSIQSIYTFLEFLFKLFLYFISSYKFTKKQTLMNYLLS